MFDLIMGFVKYAWDRIKKVFLKIVNFFTNIVTWFKNKVIIKKIREDKNKKAIVIKEKLNKGEFQIVNCLFDEATNEIEDAEVITSESLDNETLQQFGNQDMLVLK